MLDGYQGLSLAQWHQRYEQQAQWTAAIRRHLFDQIQFEPSEPILEVGSGTGAILEQLEVTGNTNLYGIDVHRSSLLFSQQSNSDFHLVHGNGLKLPFCDNAFAISLCHYLLLWVQDPVQILSEMIRVTRPGGGVIALAEPDHAARIDYPPPLDELGTFQTSALQKQGADTHIGRKLRQLFVQTGLMTIHSGILGAQWEDSDIQKIDETEWMALNADLADQIGDDDLKAYQEADRQARNKGDRVLFIPTFYALGVVA